MEFAIDLEESAIDSGRVGVHHRQSHLCTPLVVTIAMPTFAINYQVVNVTLAIYKRVPVASVIAE